MKHKFTGAKVAQPQNWYPFASGVRGVIFSNSFAQGGKVRAELYIDLQDKDLNKAVFDRLQAQREAIEKEYGLPLSWERLDERRACRIAIYQDGSIDDPPETQRQVMKWSINNLLRLKTALLPKVKDIVDALNA